VFGNDIGGEWITTGPTSENRNPATGEVAGTFVKGPAAGIDAAAAARPIALAPGGVVTIPAPETGNLVNPLVAVS